MTLKVVSESRVTWAPATSVPPILVRLSVLDLDPMYATDRQTSDRRQTDVRQHHRLMGIINVNLQNYKNRKTKTEKLLVIYAKARCRYLSNAFLRRPFANVPGQ